MAPPLDFAIRPEPLIHQIEKTAVRSTSLGGDVDPALPSCVLADYFIILLCCVSDWEIFDLKGSIGVGSDTSETTLLDYFDDLVVMTHVAYTFAVEIADFFHVRPSFRVKITMPICFFFDFFIGTVKIILIVV